MLEQLMTMVIGLIGGAAVGVQSPMAGAMGSRVGAASSSVIVHLGGLIASLAVLLLRRGEQIRDWRTLPWYLLTAGVFGLVVIQTVSHTLPRLGAAAMITLVITGQLVTGAALDHFGWLGLPARPLDPTRLLGILTLLAGGYLVSRQ